VQIRHPPLNVINEELIKAAIDEDRALYETETSAAADAVGSSAAQMSAADLQVQLRESGRVTIRPP
jgi:hypothetical protein